MQLNRVIPLLLAMVAPSLAAEPAAVDLAHIDRSIAKEPRYAGRPHYALIVFGSRAEHRSWLVMDGDETLYFDRNGNGDLTDPEDRIAQDVEATRKIHMAEGGTHSGMNVFPLGTVAGVKLNFHYWVRRRGVVPADERLRKIEQERQTNDWENGTLWRSAAKGSQAQNPVVLAARPADAQVTHLGGPLTFALKWGEDQTLRPWPQTTIFDVLIGTPALPPRNHHHRVFSPLTDMEIPGNIHPMAVVEYSPGAPGSGPVVRTVRLDLRCCGDTVYARMAVPREAGEGMAKVTLAYPEWRERVVHPATFQVPIGAPPEGHESELSYILFHDADGSFSLDDAMTALRVRRLAVQKVANGDGESLLISWRNKRAFAVTLKHGPRVIETSRDLGESSPFAEALGRCNARLEILTLPGTVVTEENQTTVTTLHAALMDETRGILYTIRDKKLSGPK
ncbi:MAG: hypothetical protein P4L84_24565 [Isosphaeraceae bacterium]|nr:hypothetical protein [Isosphaeraceae bacterium]